MTIKSDFSLLKEEVDRGLSGLNGGIPTGYNRLGKHIAIRKSTYTLLGGYTGSAKSTVADEAFILNPVDWYIKNQHNTKNKLKIIFRSMERKKSYKIARWVGRKIFLDKGIIIPVGKMLGWWGQKMSKDEHDLFLMYEDYVDTLTEIVDIIEGPDNPIGITKYIHDYAKKVGRIHEESEYKKIYEPMKILAEKYEDVRFVFGFDN